MQQFLIQLRQMKALMSRSRKIDWRQYAADLIAHHAPRIATDEKPQAAVESELRDIVARETGVIVLPPPF